MSYELRAMIVGMFAIGLNLIAGFIPFVPGDLTFSVDGRRCPCFKYHTSLYFSMSGCKLQSLGQKRKWALQIEI